MGEKANDLTEIIAHAINEIKTDPGRKFNFGKQCETIPLSAGDPLPLIKNKN